MKCISILFIVFSLLVFTNSFAQTVEMDWGQFKKLPENSLFQRIIGVDNDGFFTVRTAFDETTNENKFYLEYFSSVTNSMETTNELIFPTINGTLSDFEQIYYIKGKIIMFSSTTNQNLQTKNLFVQYINNDGTLKNKPKEIASIPLANANEDGFKISLSEDKSNIMIYYYNSFVEYNNEPFNLKIIDANLTTIFTGDIKFPLQGRRFDISQTLVGKNDNIFFMTKTLAIDPKKKKSTSSRGTQNNTTAKAVVENYDYTIYVYNTKRNELTPFEITVQKYIIRNLIFGLNLEDDIIVEGFIANKNSKIQNEFIGAFYQKINIKLLKLEVLDLKKSIMLFPKDFVANFTLERNGAPENYYDYTINKLGFFENGTIIMFAEQQYITSRTMIDPATKAETYIYYYHYNDIIGIGIDKDGKMDWVIRIPKTQVGTDDYGYYSSYALIIDANKAKIIFNDNPSNEKPKDITKIKEFSTNLRTLPKGIAFITTIYGDGNFEKYTMFPKEESKTITCPKLSAKTKFRYIVYGQKGDEYKFGTFTFN